MLRFGGALLVFMALVFAYLILCGALLAAMWYAASFSVVVVSNAIGTEPKGAYFLLPIFAALVIAGLVRWARGISRSERA